MGKLLVWIMKVVVININAFFVPSFSDEHDLHYSELLLPYLMLLCFHIRF